jgi:uncharacterized damage-inducible protein DinB
LSTKKIASNVAALLDEYKKAIETLIALIEPIHEHTLCAIVDEKTTDADCKSIQTILSHVIHSGYAYTIYIENAVGIESNRPTKENYTNTQTYIEKLQLMYNNCERFFLQNTNIKIEELDNAKKITTGWGQLYDIEQLLEHAIVHILRHSRQIKKMLTMQVE